MAWGILETDDPYVVHIVPCDTDGTPHEGHIFGPGPACSCIVRDPELNKFGVLMITHEEIN